MEDTDSMAIIATEKVARFRAMEGLKTMKSPLFPWKAGERNILNRFLALNPYNHTEIPDSILKIEDDNFIPGSRNTVPPAPLFGGLRKTLRAVSDAQTR